MKIKNQQFAQFTLYSCIKSTHKQKMGLEVVLRQSINIILTHVAYESNAKHKTLKNTLSKWLKSVKFPIRKSGGLKSNGSQY